MSETELFPPRPGGMVDQARQRAQAEQLQASALEGPWPEDLIKVEVPVSERGTEHARARTYAISTTGANPIVEVGQDINRRYAVVLAVDEPVVIAFSQSAANDPRNAANAAGLSANGFVLPTGVPVPVNSTCAFWLVAMSATLTRVSVMSFSYANPEA